MTNITDVEKAVLATPGASISIHTDRVDVTLQVRPGLNVCASGSSVNDAIKKALNLKNDLERKLSAA